LETEEEMDERNKKHVNGEVASRIMNKITKRFLPVLLICFIVSFLDRVNIGFASLTMNATLGLSASQFGLGAGLFFITYVIAEVPSNPQGSPHFQAVHSPA
jgi:sugar phosphate permease